VLPRPFNDDRVIHQGRDYSTGPELEWACGGHAGLSSNPTEQSVLT
jgi:hypothetical protein